MRKIFCSTLTIIMIFSMSLMNVQAAQTPMQVTAKVNDVRINEGGKETFNLNFKNANIVQWKASMLNTDTNVTTQIKANYETITIGNNLSFKYTYKTGIPVGNYVVTVYARVNGSKKDYDVKSKTKFTCVKKLTMTSGGKTITIDNTSSYNEKAINDSYRTKSQIKFFEDYTGLYNGGKIAYDKYKSSTDPDIQKIIDNDYYKIMAPNLTFKNVIHKDLQEQHPFVSRPDLEMQMLDVLNGERKNLGLNELQLDTDLTAITRYREKLDYSYIMSDYNRNTFFTPDYFSKNFGYTGANIIEGTYMYTSDYVNNTSTLLSILKQNPHYIDAISNPNVKKIGIGIIATCNYFPDTEENVKGAFLAFKQTTIYVIVSDKK